uniref:Uncharacterized protein n=1 Tax=Rhizobium rhizogenes TaxID=359 RepID=A0A7S4ZT56_RHIRH|nr:hypothetical protein pC5.7d_674 [Rhizobium rhizogenes]
MLGIVRLAVLQTHKTDITKKEADSIRALQHIADRSKYCPIIFGRERN